MRIPPQPPIAHHTILQVQVYYLFADVKNNFVYSTSLLIKMSRKKTFTNVYVYREPNSNNTVKPQHQRLSELFPDTLAQRSISMVLIQRNIPQKYH